MRIVLLVEAFALPALAASRQGLWVDPFEIQGLLTFSGHPLYIGWSPLTINGTWVLRWYRFDTRIYGATGNVLGIMVEGGGGGHGTSGLKVVGDLCEGSLLSVSVKSRYLGTYYCFRRVGGSKAVGIY